MDQKLIIGTAAAVLAATTFMAASASATSTCPGASACKGQGFTEVGSSFECTVAKSK
jgi:hypothetical protein